MYNKLQLQEYVLDSIFEKTQTNLDKQKLRIFQQCAELCDKPFKSYFRIIHITPHIQHSEKYVSISNRLLRTNMIEVPYEISVPSVLHTVFENLHTALDFQKRNKTRISAYLRKVFNTCGNFAEIQEIVASGFQAYIAEYHNILHRAKRDSTFSVETIQELIEDTKRDEHEALLKEILLTNFLLT